MQRSVPAARIFLSPKLMNPAPRHQPEAALTSLRTVSNSIYCLPHLQAQLDPQSSVLRAEDKDYTTADSYFFETFENLSLQVGGKRCFRGVQVYVAAYDCVELGVSSSLLLLLCECGFYLRGCGLL